MRTAEVHIEEEKVTIVFYKTGKHTTELTFTDGEEASKYICNLAKNEWNIKSINHINKQ